MTLHERRVRRLPGHVTIDLQETSLPLMNSAVRAMDRARARERESSQMTQSPDNMSGLSNQRISRDGACEEGTGWNANNRPAITSGPWVLPMMMEEHCFVLAGRGANQIARRDGETEPHLDQVRMALIAPAGPCAGARLSGSVAGACSPPPAQRPQSTVPAAAVVDGTGPARRCPPPTAGTVGKACHAPIRVLGGRERDRNAAACTSPFAARGPGPAP